MLKRCLAALTLLVLLIPCALAEEPLVLIPEKEDILRVEGEPRFVNDANAFYAMMLDSKLLDGFNTAIDALGEDRPQVYLYLVESSRSHPLARTFDENSPAYSYLLEHLHADHFDHLKYSTWEQFCDYFYATDHHWNWKGSYQGYVDIVRLLLGEEEEVLVPAETVVCTQIFNGSYAKALRKPISEEHFAFYRFDPLPTYACYTSQKNMNRGKRTAYSHYSVYLKGEMKNGRYANHYAQLYGGDAGLLIFRGEGHEDRRLLLIGNSLSNAVKPLLTAHFGTVVYVDPRHYKGKTGKAFSLSGVIEQYDITQVLLMGDINLFVYGDVPKP